MAKHKQNPDKIERKGQLWELKGRVAMLEKRLASLEARDNRIIELVTHRLFGFQQEMQEMIHGQPGAVTLRPGAPPASARGPRPTPPPVHVTTSPEETQRKIAEIQAQQKAKREAEEAAMAAKREEAKKKGSAEATNQEARGLIQEMDKEAGDGPEKGTGEAPGASGQSG